MPALAALRSMREVTLRHADRGFARTGMARRPQRFAHVHDVVGSARLMRAPDLVIAVDGTTAHLASALGVPVWTLVGASDEAHWSDADDVARWYPSMRVFRQSQPGAWDDVMGDVASSLRELVAA